jgi:ornithine carbamoyltransferase
MKGMEKRDLLSMSDISPRELLDTIKLIGEIKAHPERYRGRLDGKIMVMIFEKPSTRTRVSFESAIIQLGGHAINISRNTSQLERGETVADSAKVLERYASAIVARVNFHETLVELAANSRVPVINGLSDREHPCQIISDLFTIHEVAGTFKGVKVAYVGDGNNVCNSLLLGCAMAGVSLAVSSPDGYLPEKGIVDRAKKIAKSGGAKIEVGSDPLHAAKDADFIYTDVWISMGQEDDEDKRMDAFQDYQVNGKLLGKAGKDVKVMHCLPAHRGLEITGEVLDGESSIVWDQAENRLHAQKAILLNLLL